MDQYINGSKIMLIAHFPAGYLYRNFCEKLGVAQNLSRRQIHWACCTGAIFPDLDMFYFYFIDNRHTHHHEYWTHLPSVWLVLFVLFLVSRVFIKKSKYVTMGVLFVGGGFVHLVLDSLVGDIWWFAPLVDKPYALFEVTARYSPWFLNFILHWSFLVELLILFGSLVVFARNRSGAS